jgi:hypothetical protein
MRSIWRKIIKRRSYLHRGVVLLILILIYADLALPQVCCEELNCTSDAGAAVPSAGITEKDILGAAPTDRREPHSETPKSEMGCFCCCAHFLLKSVLTADIVAFKWRQVALSIPFLPSPPPKDQFHPPRLSSLSL